MAVRQQKTSIVAPMAPDNIATSKEEKTDADNTFWPSSPSLVLLSATGTVGVGVTGAGGGGGDGSGVEGGTEGGVSGGGDGGGGEGAEMISRTTIGVLVVSSCTPS